VPQVALQALSTIAVIVVVRLVHLVLVALTPISNKTDLLLLQHRMAQVAVAVEAVDKQTSLVQYTTQTPLVLGVLRQTETKVLPQLISIQDQY
jgi:hypothetical protein